MILYAASVVIFLFVSFNLFFRADCSMAIKIAGTAFIFFISMKYVIYQIVGGAFFSPDMPRTFILVMEALYGGLILLFFLLLLWDIYLLGNKLLIKAGIPAPAHLPTGYIRCGLAALALALGIWGTWESVKVPAVKTVEMRLPNLPQALENFSIVQLSDLHIGPLLGKEWLAEVVKRANALEPDIFALTGDYVDGRVDQLEGELAPLGELKSRYGVFAVAGNHEYYWNMPQWKKALEKLQIPLLENEHRNLNINGETLVVVGLPDLVAERFGQQTPDLERALENAPEATRLLLAHQPKNARDYASLVDIHLAGHTHGGLMFFLQPLVARFNSGFVAGKYNVEGKTLYTSSGTGLWNGFSSRVGVPSEITRIILRNG